jgi:hypothetical protein
MKTKIRMRGQSIAEFVDRLESGQYEPDDQQLREFEEAMLQGPPVQPAGARLKPKKKIPNYAEINRSFKKFCFDSGYIVQ